eukprot:TRINITY_DN471_c1_g1_i4.p1 TRINITY_DN471_c1_g1~~TRINITY_DN471_c1_g1_i4.p1  ORF type:complete len:388 (+),score=63.76 TRINITY_DN471_c1_g1_i4:197-1360(+)
MLAFPVYPGKGLGPFTLGSTLRDAITVVNEKLVQGRAYHLKYNAEQPLDTDIILDFPGDGFHLVFDPVSQLLKLIEVYDVSKVELEYSGSRFCGPDEEPTFVRVFNLYGPTRGGDVDKTGRYYLTYPGITFTFLLPAQHCSRYTGGAELPLKLPDGHSPIASRMCLYGLHTVVKTGVLDTSLISAPPVQPSSTVSDDILVSLCQGISFRHRNKSITFRSSAQDLLSDIGVPDAVHYKEGNKMAIHDPSAVSNGTDGTHNQDYFYNYFSQGFDVLIDGSNHRVKKIVMHTNFPNDPDFNQYSKSHFVLADFSYVNGLRQRSTEEEVITQDTKWPKVQELLGSAGQPAIHVKGGSSQLYAPIRYFGYPGIIFEILQNDHIASITLFEDA